MKDLENIFRNSNDNDELFDAFQSGINQRIDKIELYKVLLGNHVLTDDEIIMYTNKIAQEFREKQFEIYMWAAGLFEIAAFKIDRTERSFEYYKKASFVSPTDHTPYLNALNLYNYDIDTDLNKQVVKFVEDAVPAVNKKSIFYRSLSTHYKKTGNEILSKKYNQLAAKAAERE